MIILIDTLFRFTGIGLLLLLAVLSLRDVRKTNGAIYLILACISVSALFLGYTGGTVQLPRILSIAVRVLDVPHLIFIWLFALSLFQDQFRLTLLHGVIGMAYCLPIIYVRLAGFGLVAAFPFWVIILGNVSTIVLMAHLVISTLMGRASDLRESRRNSRIYFVAIIAFVAIITALTEIIFTGDKLVYLPTAKVIIIWPAIVWACYWILEAKTDALEFVAKNCSEFSGGEMSYRNKELAKALEKEMLVNRAFLETRLSISILARRLSVAPHRLRELINQQLGYQNFNVYLNAYRIDAIKQAFSDPKNEHIPILTIVMEYGFNSLSPFNNAFRAKEGVTPSEYRTSLNIKT
ncbi:MAG: AraC family transcriptional regulator [Robiginitomaculum sp.]|nr:AraC family transcriptional regulator [Robiginitomaculum sp.]